MKSIRILAALGILSFSVPAFADDIVFVKPLIEPNARKKLEKEKAEPKIDEGSRTGGVVPRALRSGNPLQLINPFAPAKYGNGTNMTISAADQGTTGPTENDRPTTIKVFSYEF